MATELKYKWKMLRHTDVLARFESELESIPHAMLLSGPAEIGKLTLMKRLAKILQAGGFEGKLADEIESEVHLDTQIHHDDGKPLKIATIREVKKFMSLSNQGAYKITILQNVERLTIPAANSLLKILEEPPKGSVFMLTSSNLAEVLPTIISRCRIYRTSVGSEVSKEIPSEIWSISAGKIGRGFKLQADDEAAGKQRDLLDKANKLIEKNDLIEGMKLAESLNELDRHEVIAFLKLLLWQSREADLSPETLEEVQKTINLVSQNVNIRLALEVLFLQCFTHLV